MLLNNLSNLDIEQALRNSGYDFNSVITDAEFVGCVDDGDHDRTETAIYEISWDVSNHEEPVTFCNTVYVTYDPESLSYYADI